MVKIGNLLVLFGDVIHLKNSIYAFTFFDKPTGQQTRSLLALFNIPIHEICRTFVKYCMETLKVEKFWIFCHFRCLF